MQLLKKELWDDLITHAGDQVFWQVSEQVNGRLL